MDHRICELEEMWVGSLMNSLSFYGSLFETDVGIPKVCIRSKTEKSEKIIVLVSHSNCKVASNSWSSFE